jgi:hypothetical protein
VVRPSQDWEIDGLCESPHDNPPQWAIMLTAYFDESFESPRGYAVMAGFLGNKEAWKKCAKEWREGLGAKDSLHMKALRWKNDRPKDLLEKLGPIPHRCGLRPIYSSVKVADYVDDLSEYATEGFTKGYFITLMGATASVLMEIPKGQRVEFIFEEQGEFAAVREHALGIMAKNPVLRGKRGKSALAKWSSIPKSSLLEPADYLAYAIMQWLVDPDSSRSKLCPPIFGDKSVKMIGGRMGKEHVARILELKDASV